MEISEFERLIKKDTCQVFLFASPTNLPFSFAMHPWFVINNKGMLERWEVLFRKKCKCQTHWGHLHKDFLPLFSGIEVIPFYRGLLWPGKLLSSIEGESARQCSDFIKRSPQMYPYCNTYSLVGPNSNTYAQWVLNNFPEWQVKLPGNAFGKRYA